jgi:AcrR family transcriptional regulator
VGPSDRRERERQETRRKILDAARELCLAEGVEAVSMRKIAERVEYSPTAIYLHFRDKEALLKELCDDDFRTFGANFAQSLSIPDPIERLRRIGQRYIAFGLDYPSQFRFMFMTIRPQKKPHESSVEKGNPEQDAYALLRGTIAQAIEENRLRPELRDADAVAQLAWASMHGIVSLHMVKCTDEWIEMRPPRALAEHMIDVLIRGLTVRDEGGA